MKKSLSRVLSLALVLAMLIGVMPMAMADEVITDHVGHEASAEGWTWELDEANSTPATCGKAGELKYNCTFVDSTTNAKCTSVKTVTDPIPEGAGSDGKCLFADKENSNTATCTAAGEKTQECSVCGATQKVPTEKLGHEWGTDGKCIRCDVMHYTVTVTPDSVTLKINSNSKSASLSATVVDNTDGTTVSDATITWSDDADDTVMTLSNGTVTAVATKLPDDVSYTVTATYAEKFSGTAAITLADGDVYIDQDSDYKSGTAGFITLNPVLRYVEGNKAVEGVTYSYKVKKGKASVDPNTGTVTSNSHGVSQIEITATWAGETKTKDIYVSFYEEFEVTVKSSKTKFHLEEDNVLSSVKVDGQSVSSLNNDSVYDILNYLSNDDTSFVKLWTSSNNSASGKLSSSSNVDYSTYGTVLYQSKLKPITFEQIAGKTGDAVIHFQLGNASADSPEYVVTATGTIEVNFGDVKADITYQTTKDAAVTFDEDDFDKFFDASKASGSLEYVVFGVDSTIPETGALYTDDTNSAKTVSSTMDFYYRYDSKENDGNYDYDLDEVTYEPYSRAKEAYTDLIPFTCYSTSSGVTVSGVVAIEVTDELPFTDVAEKDWYFDYVSYVYNKGIMNGTSSTKFSPNNTLTRGMVVTMLYRIEGEPSVASYDTFKDVDDDEWYYKAVEWAAKYGIVNGITATTFGPEQNITREQLAAILYRYADYKDLSTSTGSTKLTSFTDYKSVSSYAETAMKWAVYNTIINGRTATTLAPKGTATRAEAAKMLYVFLEG